MSYLKEGLFEQAAQLRPDMQPEWGSMTPQHIIEHFIMALAISSGVLDMPVMGKPERVQKNYESVITNDEPLAKGIKLPFVSETPMPYEYANIADAIEQLRGAVERFYAYFAQNPDAKPNHPAFGGLSFGEWERFHEKHFKHHFAQFGI